MPGLRTEDITADVGYKNATIANGQSLSGAVDLLASRPAFVITPDTLTDGDMTFQASYDGVNFFDLYDKDGEVKIPAAVVDVNRAISLDLSTFFSLRYLKIRTGTAAVPVVQTAQRILVISTIPR